MQIIKSLNFSLSHFDNSPTFDECIYIPHVDESIQDEVLPTLLKLTGLLALLAYQISNPTRWWWPSMAARWNRQSSQWGILSLIFRADAARGKDLEAPRVICQIMRCARSVPVPQAQTSIILVASDTCGILSKSAMGVRSLSFPFFHPQLYTMML